MLTGNIENKLLPGLGPEIRIVFQQQQREIRGSQIRKEINNLLYMRRPLNLLFRK